MERPTLNDSWMAHTKYVDSCSKFTIRMTCAVYAHGKSVVQQLTRFRLTSGVARSLCDGQASCWICAAKHTHTNTHKQTNNCSLPASQMHRPFLHVPCPLQTVGSPGQLTSSICCTISSTTPCCCWGSLLVVFTVDLMSKMHTSFMSLTTPSNEPAMMSISCNEWQNSQLAAIFAQTHKSRCFVNALKTARYCFLLVQAVFWSLLPFVTFRKLFWKHLHNVHSLAACFNEWNWWSAFSWY